MPVRHVGSSVRVFCFVLVGFLGLAACADREPPSTEATKAPETSDASEDTAPPTQPEGLDGADQTDELSLARTDLGTLRKIDPADRHLYDLDLKAGSLLHVEVEQHACDVFVQLLRGDEVLIQVDSRTQDRDSEHLVYLVPDSASYWLAIESYDDNPSGVAYRTLVRAERPAEERDRLWARAEHAFATANTARQQGSKSVDIPSELERAAALFAESDRPKRQGDALYELALLDTRARRPRRAVSHLEASLRSYRSAGAEHDLAVSLSDQAALLADLGQPGRARQNLEQAAEIFRRLGNADHEATALHSLGRIELRRGRMLRSIELFERSLDLNQEIGDRGGIIHSLNGLGEAYLGVGEMERSMDHHRRAFQLAEELGRDDLMAYCRYFLGSARIAAGDLDGAAESYRAALDDSRRGGGAINPAHLQVALGLVEMRRGSPDVAYELFREAQTRYVEHDDLVGQAACHHHLASLFLQLGDTESSLDVHRRALEIYRRLEDHDGEARSLLGIAQALRSLGRLEEALSNAEAALLRVEQILVSGQAPATRSDLALPYLTSRQEYFSFLVDLLMELHRMNPEKGYDALALATSEQSRARVLLELVADGTDHLRTVAPDLSERRKRLQAEINASAWLAAAGPFSEDGGTQVASDVDLRRRLVELYRVTHEIHHRDDDGLHTQTLSLTEVMDLLGDETSLLQYRLGEERSYLWLVDSSGLSSHVLPARDAIDRLGLRTYQLLIQSDQVTHRVPTESAVAELSETILGPVRDRLDVRRLLVVADGSLSYLPFGVLETTPGGSRLLDRHEIVYAPSTSVVSALRERATLRDLDQEPERGLLALLADPVLQANDERFGGDRPTGAFQSVVEVSTTRDRFDALRRLPHTAREADSIRRLALPLGKVLSATGFEADRELVLGGRLADYEILHFATHGVLNANHAEFSALALSRYGADGTEKAGWLPLHEIYSLDLPADLVVLSACRSALGPESRAEGLLGLPRGFLHAGARRVLVSLWRVDDESTAELMTRFYQHLLEGRLDPATALREAQNSLRAEARYEAPYHWAGFVLQGDWL